MGQYPWVSIPMLPSQRGDIVFAHSYFVWSWVPIFGFPLYKRYMSQNQTCTEVSTLHKDLDFHWRSRLNVSRLLLLQNFECIHILCQCHLQGWYLELRFGFLCIFKVTCKGQGHWREILKFFLCKISVSLICIQFQEDF